MSLSAAQMCSNYRATVDKDHLVVADVSDDDGGIYTCVANTTLDSVSASAVLRVVGKNWTCTCNWLPCFRQEKQVSGVNVCL